MLTGIEKNILDMHFSKKLKKIIRDNNSHLIVGLDTDLRKLPDFIKRNFSGDKVQLFNFNRMIIEATKDIVCGYKVNSAFYEAAGSAGWEVMKETVKSIPENLITIADAKRGDIENTTELYAVAFLDEIGFDAITVQPYMGQDSVRPFIRRKNKFAFVLTLTSNYGSKDFQLLKIDRKPLWEHVVEKCFNWNDHKIGFVIGAGHTKEIEKITKKYPDTSLLIPGIGAQKYSLENLIKALNHNLFLINQSRAIIYSAQDAENENDFISNISVKTKSSNDEINQLLKLKKIK